MSLPVVITLTTIPPRFNQTAKNIEHILQNLKDVKVVLNCPKIYKRFKENEKGRIELHKLQNKYKQFIINENINDYGPITKLLPTLNMFNYPHILIICDDEKYHIDAFKKIIKYQNTNIQEVYSYWVYDYPKNGINKISVPQGVDMISVYSPFMNDFVYNHKCFYVDDLLLGYYFKQKGIRVKQIPRDWKWPWIPTHTNTPSLFNLKGTYSRDNQMGDCFKYLG